MLPVVDLVITFRASPKVALSKQQIREDSVAAEKQYSRLLNTLSYAGLRAVARRGESLGHLLIFVNCPEDLLKNLVKREKHSDFLSGLPTTPIKSDSDIPILAPSDRIRLVHAYVSATPIEGGLGIHPGASDWSLVESIMCLHDKNFNDQWLHAWTRSKTGSVSAENIRDQFGESVALYFSFLKSYTRALIFPAALGTGFYFFGTPYSPVYSSLLVVWSVVFVEWWRARERIISLRFGSRGSFRVEKRRADYDPTFSWWKREIRMLASLPVILLFAGILVTLLTAIFVFEAFITQIYTGPGHQLLGFSPTVLLVVLVPKFLAVYQSIAKRFTNWENHAHHSSHSASLTLKTFALTSLVAYLGLALSAYVYVPFGEGVMRIVQSWFFNGGNAGSSDEKSVWDVDVATAGRKLNPARLTSQMFAYTVTAQVSNTFTEVGLPFILRAVERYRKKKDGVSTPKKKVAFEDEKLKGGQEEREFLEAVRHQVALPEYDLFMDYNEMATQFGYVALWSTIWPLASLMALINNFFELRSDAFKIISHNRRPIPVRTDTIGPWLEALTFLTWLSALTNTSLVYLFCPRSQNQCEDRNLHPSSIDKVHARLFTAAGTGTVGEGSVDDTVELLKTALLIAFAASHGFMLLQSAVRHVVERAVYKESEEVKDREREDREIKESFLRGVVMKDDVKGAAAKAMREVDVDDDVFWGHDEGVQEIQRISKEA